MMEIGQAGALVNVHKHVESGQEKIFEHAQSQHQAVEEILVEASQRYWFLVH